MCKTCFKKHYYLLHDDTNRIISNERNDLGVDDNTKTSLVSRQNNIKVLVSTVVILVADKNGKL